MKMSRKIYTILLVVVVVLFFSTCEKDKDIPISTAQVDITEVTPGYCSVQQKGFFVSNATITSAELHYANDSSFSDYKTLALDVSKDKSYTAIVAPLQHGATYYVRYKVANAYSALLLPQIDTLHTLAYTLPKVITDSVGSITAESAVGYGTLADWGCDSLSECGFCYGSSANPTIEGKHIVCTEKDNHFSGTMNDLDDGERYYIRAYAVNPMGVAYGEERSFTTAPITLPTVVTLEPTDISVSSAVCGGKITSNGNTEITECGICYSEAASPTIDGKILVCKQNNVGEFSGTIAGLSESTTYYVRAYATNAKGTAYGEERSFTTAPITLPTVVTLEPTDISVSSAVCGGKITSNGNTEITECGICYSEAASPTIDGKILVCKQNNVGEFSGTIAGLSESTTYYVRAYATNAKGTAYGEELSFTTATHYTSYTSVDLGLSVKWATCNVGATSPEKYGNYYAWGETETKKNYLLDTYKYGSAYNALTKYCNNSSYGEDNFTDNLITLEASDDAAAKNWGDNWRMPTDAEWTELREKCTWTWTSNYNGTGVAGYEVKASNGNSIFLPAAGCRLSGGLSYAGSDGYYWSSSLNAGKPYSALYGSFDSDSVLCRCVSYRYCGLSVRPVQAP